MRLMPVNPGAKSVWTRLPVRVYAVALALLGVLLASYFLFAQPKNQAMSAVRAEIQNRQASLKLLEVEMAKLEGSKRRLEQLQKTLAGFDDRLPRRGEIDVLLREVWVVADAAGLKTQRIKTLKEKQFGGYGALPLELNLRGPFEGVYGFLLALERMPGMMKIESLNIHSAKGEAASGVEVGLVLNVFCRA